MVMGKCTKPQHSAPVLIFVVEIASLWRVSVHCGLRTRCKVGNNMNVFSCRICEA